MILDLAGRIWKDQAGEIEMDQVFVSSLNSTDGVLEDSRSSKYEEKSKMAKIEPKRAKLMRKSKMTKL